MTKQEIRSEMRIQRDRYPFVHRDSVKIWDVLENQEMYHRVRSLFAYFSFGSEVETYFILEDARRREKCLCLPRVEAGGKMDFYQLDDVRHMQRNRFGVYEPSPWEIKREPSGQTLMLVPGLAFDKKGNRIGFGSGYYDRYLERFPEVITMGICFDFQLLNERLPAEETDRRMQYILTPQGIYSVKKGDWN